uniref:Uncharacterized protein n=1 Tax=Melanopsichium pennsylvanicum 4 TaxID=1398559 RepID=A0A077R2V8_9BASI|nr:conserved hypothetical protein [Melanopsichium pennsylvanicum 4]
MTEASTSTKSGLARYLTNQTDFLNPKSPTSPLPALYADLSRQRKTNPAGFRSNIEWWRNMLLDVTFKGVQYEFDPPCPISASASASDVDVDTEKPKSGGGGDEVDRTVFRLDESTKARWTVDGDQHR